MIGEREKRLVYPLGYGRGIQGRQGPRGSDHLFLDQTEARRAKHFFFGDRAPPAYLKVWIRHWDTVFIRISAQPRISAHLE